MAFADESSPPDTETLEFVTSNQPDTPLSEKDTAEQPLVTLDSQLNDQEPTAVLLTALADFDLTGAGTVDLPYLIASKENLQTVREYINSTDADIRSQYPAAYYQLTTNIDMAGEDWTPLGLTTAAFTGSFDGNGKTIQNLTVSGESYVGFFGYVNGGTITGLALEDVSVKATSSYAGGIVANITGGIIDNCSVSGTITTKTSGTAVADGYAGGIVGYVTGIVGSTLQISNCTVVATVTGVNYVGGVIGSTAPAATAAGNIIVQNCEVNGTVKATTTSTTATAGFTGGIIGRTFITAGFALQISGCDVTADIIGTSNTAGIAGSAVASGTGTVLIEGCTYSTGTISAAGINVGGIGGTVTAAATGSASVYDCANAGTINATTATSDNVGGILGTFTSAALAASKDANIAYCTVDAVTVTGRDYIGGIVGRLTAGVVQDSSFVGTITARAYVGGILGSAYLSSSTTATVENCYVLGNITTSNTGVGGIIGYQYNGSITVSGSHYNGDITTSNTGAANAGGIVGTCATATIQNCYSGGSVTASGTAVGGIVGVVTITNGTSIIGNCYSTSALKGTGNVGGLVGFSDAKVSGANTGYLRVLGSRALNQYVSRTSGTAVTIGALFGSVTNASLTSADNSLAWKGLKLGDLGGEATVGELVSGDPFCNTTLNGSFFVSYTLETAAGWPAGFSNAESVWDFVPGKLPTLTTLSDTLSNTYPAYLSTYLSGIGSDIRASAGDRAALAQLITDAEALQLADYGDGWNEFQAALTEAKLAYTGIEELQLYFDNATAALQTAFDILKDKQLLVWAGGTGTPADPWQINSVALLQKMNRLFAEDALFRSSSYELTSDIDMRGEIWLPYLDRASATTQGNTAFVGSFDGNRHAISNLSVQTAASYTGLFAYLGAGALVLDLTLKDCNINSNGGSYTGGIAGHVNGDSAKIESCQVSGTVSNTTVNTGGITGGIAGQITGVGATIDNCSFNGVVVCPQSSAAGVGGIVGNMSGNTMIKNCIVGGDVTGPFSVGGIIGQVAAPTNSTITIQNCMVEGDVKVTNLTSATNVGGIIGTTATWAIAMDLSGCYFNGTLTGVLNNSNAGGIIGFTGGATSGIISNNRSDGTVRLANSAGGILGAYGGNAATGALTIENSYTTVKIGNAVKSGGIVGDNTVINGAGTLSIIDCVVLSDCINASTAANTIQSFTNNIKLGTLSGNIVWDGSLINGNTLDSDQNIVGYYSLQTGDNWPTALQSAPWEYTEGSLPVLAAIKARMDSSFPLYMSDPNAPRGMEDFSALINLITRSASFVETEFSVDSWSEFQAKLSAATAVRDAAIAGTTNQAEVDAAKDALLIAIDGLTPAIDPGLSGTGKVNTPYLIGSVADFDKMRTLLTQYSYFRNAHYKLAADLDFGGSDWQPLTPFSGDFDGGGYTLYNLTSSSGSSGFGLFGTITGGSVHNLNLADCNISISGNKVGTIAGQLIDGTIKDCSATGTVTGRGDLGGIVGNSLRSTIENCDFEGTVRIAEFSGWSAGIERYVGGIAGTGSSSNFIGCTVKGLIDVFTDESVASVGGIVGLAMPVILIVDCHVDADITVRTSTISGGNSGGNNVGGVVGTIMGATSAGGDAVQSGTISDSSYSGTITTMGGNNGGIVGSFGTGGVIENCQTEGKIIGNGSHPIGISKPTGGLVGNAQSGSNVGSVIKDSTSNMELIGFDADEVGSLIGHVDDSKYTGKITLDNNQVLNPNPDIPLVAGDVGNKANVVIRTPPVAPSNPDSSGDPTGYMPITPGVNQGLSITTDTAAAATAIDSRTQQQPPSTSTSSGFETIYDQATPEAAENLTFFEVVAKTIQDNPWILWQLITLLAVVIVAGAIWRYRQVKNS